METTKEIDIHHRDLRVKSAYRLLENSKIYKENKKLILEFVKHKKTAQHIGRLREAKTLWTLRILAELWGRPFCDLKPKKRNDKGIEESRKKLEWLLDKAYNRDIVIQSPKTGAILKKGKPSDSTRRDYFIFLKMFYSWLVGRKHPEEFDWIRIPKALTKKPKVKDLLTPEDILRLSSVAMNSRDLLIPQLLWETGARIEEIASLRIEDIESVNDGEFYILHLNRSKKDISGEEAVRSIAVDDCSSALVNWLNHHPRRSDKSAPLLVNLSKNNEAMDYEAVKIVLWKLKKRSKLSKRVNPHFFRKSATSYLRSKKKMPDSSLKTRHGWKPASDMLNIYASNDQEEANKDYLRTKGKFNDNKPEEDKVKPAVCKYCGTKNPIGVDYCVTCKRPLNLTKEEKEIKVRIENRIAEMLKEKLIKQHPNLMDEITTELKREGL